MNQYKVGATWRGDEIASYRIDANKTYSNNRKAEIWLERRDGDFEVWRWNTYYASGASDEQGWAPSYRGCKAQLPFPCRMRKVK